MSSNENLAIAVVEDDEPVRRSIEALLAAVGFRTTTFGDAESFLEWLTAGGELDCLLLDLRLPGMTGLQVIERIGQSDMRFPIIVLTAYGDVQGGAQGIDALSVDFFEKPVRPSTLLARISELTQADRAPQRGSSDRVEAESGHAR